MNEDQVKELVRSWYKSKAKNEKDDYFKLLCLWICFNAWLSFISSEDSDSKMLNKFLKNKLNAELKTAYENMSKTTTGLQALKDLVTMSPILDSRGIKPAVVIIDENDQENIVWGIYRVRCNLFHGGKTLNDSRDRKLVACVNRILDKWMSELIALWH